MIKVEFIVSIVSLIVFISSEKVFKIIAWRLNKRFHFSSKNVIWMNNCARGNLISHLRLAFMGWRTYEISPLDDGSNPFDPFLGWNPCFVFVIPEHSDLVSKIHFSFASRKVLNVCLPFFVWPRSKEFLFSIHLIP